MNSCNGQGGNFISINNANFNYLTFPSIVPNGSPVENPTKQCIKLAIVDTGTNDNFFSSSTKCDYIKLAIVSFPVKMPNGKIIHSTHTGIIPNDSIPLAACRAHLFKELDQALISIGFFCDNGCMELFDDAQVVIFNNKKQRNFDERCQKYTHWPLNARLRTKDKATKYHDGT